MLKSGRSDGCLVSAGLLRAKASPPAKMKSRNHPPSGEHHTMQLSLQFDHFCWILEVQE
jgi:hypothetical protein